MIFPMRLTNFDGLMESHQEITKKIKAKETGAALEAYLHSLVDPYGEVTASQIASRLRGNVLTVTLTAECREELGTQAPIYTANEPDGASG